MYLCHISFGVKIRIDWIYFFFCKNKQLEKIIIECVIQNLNRDFNFSLSYYNSYEFAYVLIFVL